ncbi:MMPL family transporter [Actinomadura spongiicola]|uniref:MMPL family transporter n=1 Tax=Actinomadura spongiicola TaxID=2303421 RepID=A0A372GE77_9ACTN|nr:MMPL family transporter [Actinomadura spongiicola]RFS83675.1 MMPL family transporter [Actinomadura spongiicola]
MFARLGRVAARRRWWVVAGTVVLVITAGVWGTGVFRSLTGGSGFDDPNSESVHANQVLEGPLGRHVADVVVLYQDPTKTVDDPAFSGPVQRAVAGLPAGSTKWVRTYWSTRDTSFVSRDRHATYVALQLPSNDEQERVEQLKALKKNLQVPGLKVTFGGLTSMTQQVNAQSLRDVGRAELFSMPLLLLLLVLVFRSAVAALLPFVVGIAVAFGSLVVLRLATFFSDVSTFAVNVVTIFALALTIDYGLLIVNRFREELARGVGVEDAVERTVATAGRTVLFSGLTVGASLTCVIVFPSRFMHSMGYAGVGVALFSVVGSLTLLPALLTFAGHRVDSLRVPLPGRRRQVTPGAVAHGRWYSLARAVMRRPLAVTAAVVVLLVALGLPFLSANWARPGDWVQPKNGEARSVTQALGTRFAADPAKVMTVAVELPGPADQPGTRAALDDYARRLDAVPNVTGGRVTGTAGATARITLGYSIDPMSRAARTMVSEVRSEAPPQGARASVTGMPASRVDIVHMVSSRLPWMLLFVGVVSFIVLFLAFGSVVLPLKSIVLILLSLSAALGAIRLIFQDGYLDGLLGFVPIGAVDVNFPLLVVVIAFGVAMDYEVFLMARIKEEWDATGDLEESVAAGIQQTAKIVTSAALLLCVVVGGFVFSQITVMKMIGVGVVLAVLVDASLVRGLLLPATIKLVGPRVWWAPRPLARWWEGRGGEHDEAFRPWPVGDTGTLANPAGQPIRNEVETGGQNA